MNNQLKIPLDRNKISTLHDLFKARISATPYDVGYSTFNQRSQKWVDTKWVEVFKLFVHVRNAIASENLTQGDRILIALPNGIEWIAIEQAALNLGIVFVALHPTETVANINHIIDSTNPRLVFINSDGGLNGIIAHTSTQDEKIKIIAMNNRINYSTRSKNIKPIYFRTWLKNGRNFSQKNKPIVDPKDLATIIFTSGTTGKPKGVMHSHESLLNNAYACMDKIKPSSSDKLLSTTSASHIMERIAGYYVPIIAGARVCFSKSNGTVLEDLQETNANILITTPYILECAFQTLLIKYPLLRKTISQYIDYKNGQAKYQLSFILWPVLGKLISRTIKKQFMKNLNQIFCGGASLSKEILSISRLMEIPILEGYGQTEAGGIVSVNTKNNIGVGNLLNNVAFDIKDDKELLLKSNSIMMGYWNDDLLSQKTVVDQWLHTGDLAVVEDGFLHLLGRKSQLIQLANGKKVSAYPIEQKILGDNLFENVMLFGENHEKLTLICQLCEKTWASFVINNKRKSNNDELSDKNKHSLLSVRINTLIKSLPDHHFIDFIIPTFEPWNIENGLLNYQGKVDHEKVTEFYSQELKSIYTDIYVR